jgi:hypothetical protein
VRVVENGERTEVAVTDDNDAPVTQGPGLSLLKLLFEAIKTDAEGKPNAEGEETPKTGGDEQPGIKEENSPTDGEIKQQQ